MPETLPTAQETQLDDWPATISAYNICLELENQATTAENCMYARILGYLILHAPSRAAQDEVVTSILACDRYQDKLLELGKCFRLWFILPLKQSKGHTPTPSDHPSRPEFNEKVDIKENVNETPKDHQQAKAKALIRDGYKCAVTGIYDAKADVNLKTVRTVNTELAHILPQSAYFSMANAPTGSSEKNDYAASVLAVMQHFGYDINKLNGSKVHSLFNVMTMDKNSRDAFDRLEMWFESTLVANCYHVRSTRLIQNVPDKVTFTSTNPVEYPLPSQQLLALHAACAKVAHLSGAGEHIDKLHCDADELGVLAADGSSFAVLTDAIIQSIARPISAAA